MNACSVEGCQTPALSRGYCNSHYKRFRRHGDPRGGSGYRDRRSVEARFLAGYNHVSSGCWEWQNELDADGYGVIRTKKRHILAHRYSFERFTGSADIGEVDHRCRNRKCVNPEHLREVSRAQNNQNQATVRPTRSGYRGVAWHEYSQRWHVVVTLHGRQHSGGYFKDVHVAGRAAIELRNSLYTHNEEDRRLTA